MAEENKNGEMEEPKSYDDMSVDELEAELVRTGGIVPDPEEESQPALEPEPEPVAAESEVPEPQESPIDSPTPNVDEAPAEPDLPDESQIQLQEMQLELERLRQERERFEYQTGRATGEVGFLKKELERMRQQAQARPQEDYDYPAEAPQVQHQPSAPSGLEGQVAELLEGQKASAVERVYSDFLNQMANDLKAQGVEQDKVVAEQEAIMAKITPTLRERFEPFGDVSTLNAKSLEKVTRMVLQGAYTDTKLAKIAELRQKVAERKASQIADNKIVKQAAQPSGSGGRPVKEPPPKSPQEMTAEEADAALIAEFGEERGRLRSRLR